MKEIIKCFQCGRLLTPKDAYIFWHQVAYCSWECVEITIEGEKDDAKK